jgi:hypothetical protein
MTKKSVPQRAEFGKPTDFRLVDENGDRVICDVFGNNLASNARFAVAQYWR